MVLASVWLFVAPPSSLTNAIVWAAFGIGCVPLILIGIHRHRPISPRSWQFGAATVFLAGTDPLVRVIDQSVGNHGILPAIWGPIMAVTGLTTMVLWVRSKRSRWELTAILDPAIFCATGLVLAWELALRFRWDGSAPLSAMMTDFAYVMVNVAFFAVYFHILRSSTSGRLNSAFFMLWIGVLLSSSGTWLSLAFITHPSWMESWTDAARFFGCFTPAAAALHPSVIHVTAPAAPVRSKFGGRQLALLALALCTPVLTVIVAIGRHELPDLRVWLPLSIVSLTCVAARVGTVMRERDMENAKAIEGERRAEAVAVLGHNALGTFELSAVVENAVDVLHTHVADSSIAVRERTSSSLLETIGEKRLPDGVLRSIPIDTNTIEGRAVETGALQIDDNVLVAPLGTDEHVYGTVTIWSTRKSFSDGEVLLVKQVANVLTTAMRRQQYEQEGRQSQRLEAVGRLAAGIAHEINTPIQFVCDNLRFLDSTFDELLTANANNDDNETSATPPDLDFLREEIPAAFSSTFDGMNRIATIVSAMKTFGDPNSKQTSTQINLNEIVETTLVVANSTIPETCTIERRLDEIPTMAGRADEINQVVLNLLLNAIEAIKSPHRARTEPGHITLATWSADDTVHLTITDNGCGISDEIKAKVWDPFFTTKELGEGMGQGLSLIRAVVQGHGGKVSFDSNEMETTFHVELPIHRATSPVGAEPSERFAAQHA